jgi:exosortase
LSTLSPDATLAANLGDPTRARNVGGLTPAAWIRIGVIALLLCSLFWPNLTRLWYKTNPLSTQPDAGNWQHGIFVPLIGLYYLYANREQLLRAPVRSRRLGTGRRDRDLRTLGYMFLLTWALPAAAILGLGLHNSDLAPRLFIAITVLFLNAAASLYIPSAPLGLIILLEGLLVALFGIHPWHMDFAWDMGMVITLFGVVLMLCGWDVMKVAWFPIAFLVCALPWPGLVYSWVAGPLQTLAARAAVATLRFTGVDIIRSGTKMLMMVPNHTTGQEELRVLNVAEACAGLRSLMTFITVAAAVAFLSARPLWQKLVIVASAVPIAIFCNVMRVTGQGLLDRYVSQKLAEDFAHQFVGVVMMVPAFLLILLVCWLLDHLFIDEVDEYERQRLRHSGGRGADKKVIQIQRTAAAPAVAGAAGAAAPARPAAPAAQRPGVVPPPRPAGFPRPAGNVGPVARAAPKQVAPGQAPATRPPAPAPAQQNTKPQPAKPAGQAPVQPTKPAQPTRPAPQQRGEQK